MDLTLAYALGPVTVSLADLCWEGVQQTRNTIGRHYFHFGADSPPSGGTWSKLVHFAKVPLHACMEYGTVRRSGRELKVTAPMRLTGALYPFAVKGRLI